MVRSRQAESPAPKGMEQRKRAGSWLQERRKAAGLSQIELAQRLGLKYYTFISQVEAWARALNVAPAEFARHLLACYEPELHKLLFEVKA